MPWSDQGITISTGVWSRCCTALGTKTGSRRTSLQDQLSADDYSTMVKEELEDLAGNRLRALENIENNKIR
jgi:hypothetical protein